MHRSLDHLSSLSYPFAWFGYGYCRRERYTLRIHEGWFLSRRWHPQGGWRCERTLGRSLLEHACTAGAIHRSSHRYASSIIRPYDQLFSRRPTPSELLGWEDVHDGTRVHFTTRRITSFFCLLFRYTHSVRRMPLFFRSFLLLSFNESCLVRLFLNSPQDPQMSGRKKIRVLLLFTIKMLSQFATTHLTSSSRHGSPPHLFADGRQKAFSGTTKSTGVFNPSSCRERLGWEAFVYIERFAIEILCLRPVFDLHFCSIIRNYWSLSL
jgi:hypothetical protein